MPRPTLSPSQRRIAARMKAQQRCGVRRAVLASTMRFTYDHAPMHKRTRCIHINHQFAAPQEQAPPSFQESR